MPDTPITDKQIDAAANEHGMVAVVAETPMMDNGHRYQPGATLHMHRDLIVAHVATGQVRLAASPADKQAKSTGTK